MSIKNSIFDKAIKQKLNSIIQPVNRCDRTLILARPLAVNNYGDPVVMATIASAPVLMGAPVSGHAVYTVSTVTHDSSGNTINILQQEPTVSTLPSQLASINAETGSSSDNSILVKRKRIDDNADLEQKKEANRAKQREYRANMRLWCINSDLSPAIL